MDFLYSGLKVLAIVTGSLSICAVSLAYLVQNKLLYKPRTPLFSSKTPLTSNPKDRGLHYDDIWLTTEDNERLQCWLFKRSSTAPTILFLHGAGGNIGSRLDSIELFLDKLNCNVFILGYRGYGNSTGTPTEEGLQYDIRAAVRYVFEEASIDTSKVFLLGRSLGGAAAIYAASTSEHRVRGLIIENTFTSISQLTDYWAPRLTWVRALILRNHWDSIERIPSIEIPIMFVSGRQDALIPPVQMDQLYAAATRAQFKHLHTVEDGQHHSTWRVAPLYHQWLSDFIQNCLAS